MDAMRCSEPSSYGMKYAAVTIKINITHYSETTLLGGDLMDGLIRALKTGRPDTPVRPEGREGAKGVSPSNDKCRIEQRRLREDRKGHENVFKQLMEEKGSVLVIAMFALVILTLLGIAAGTITETELQISGNQKRHKIAFYAAESGIEAARSALNGLKVADSGNWDKLLIAIANQDGTQVPLTWNGQTVNNLNEVIETTGARTVGPASFSLEVRDNIDLDGDNLVDTDNVLIVTSRGSYANAEAIIEARVLYTGGGDEYAQEHYDSMSTGKAAREDTAVTNNKRW